MNVTLNLSAVIQLLTAGSIPKYSLGQVLMIQLKRVYEKEEKHDGARFLVERLWPRGLRKSELKMDGWQKEVGPSNQLRKWFSHDPQKWNDFQHRYFSELEKRPEAWQPILRAAERGRVTLLYSSHDQEHNNAVALKHFLEAKMVQRKVH